MCLIIHKPAGVEVPTDLLQNAWEDNSDGAGIMWAGASDGSAPGLQVYKVMPGDWADPARHIDGLVNVQLRDVEAGIHFRWRTHGPITEDMTHPYSLPGGRGYVMHNGVLSQHLDKDYPGSDVMSDTLYYVRKHMTDVPVILTEEHVQSLGAHIGQNRFLLLDGTGKFHIVNRPLWARYKGLLLSNQNSVPEMSNYLRGRRGGYYVTRESSRKYTTAGATVTNGTKASDWAPDAGTVKTLPARLTRRERRIFRDCLRVGHWGPFDRLGK